MKNKTKKLSQDQKLQRAARVSWVRRVAQENEERFERMFDRRAAFVGEHTN